MKVKCKRDFSYDLSSEMKSLSKTKVDTRHCTRYALRYKRRVYDVKYRNCVNPETQRDRDRAKTFYTKNHAC